MHPTNQTEAQVHHLNRELLAERTRVKALSEELENPLNVHRCGLCGGHVTSALGGWDRSVGVDAAVGRWVKC